ETMTLRPAHIGSLYCLALFAASAHGQISSRPRIPAPADKPFRSLVQLNIDATDTSRGIIRITESIPVQSPGDMVLLYPEWETTSHSPTATAVELAGLQLQGDGHILQWHRDPFNVHAFHVTVPTGTQTLSLQFNYLPRDTSELRPAMIDIAWHRMLLYPAGWYARNLTVAASLRLPAHMQAFTSLHAVTTTSTDGPVTLTYTPETLDRLVDAPVYAALHAQQLTLGTPNQDPVHLDVLADAESDLSTYPAIVTQLRALVVQTQAVFGPPPFSHYETLVSLSDDLRPGGGQEHREEGENNLPANFLTDYEHQLSNRDLIAHEYVHAWNGVYRQPKGLWSPTFNQPTDPSLLWVYEGQTEFWGRILAARSGMRTLQQTLDQLAIDAALVADRPGRAWKNLADGTLDALYMPGHSPRWRDWQRREDYYPEGVLLWLDVNAHLQELSNNQVGLDNFATRFFAAHGPTAPTSTYTFNDVVQTLHLLASDDWAAFLNQHLQTHDTRAVMAGLERSGWRLTYKPVPTEAFVQAEADAGVSDLSYSIGIQVRQNGTLRAVLWDGPAFQAGLAPGATITTVNDKPFKVSLLRDAITASAQHPIRLSVQSNGETRNITLPYAGPLRYPTLEPIPSSVDRLTPLLSAHHSSAVSKSADTASRMEQ
ncbi:MAG: hypothetical protein V4734_11505, partial [Terriglobus sp.]